MQLQKIEAKIFEIRGQKIMLDFDLAELYEVETKALNQAVKRNLKRFPEDFMFRLSLDEWVTMRSHFVTASRDKRNVSATPYAFTEQGVSMLSGILTSDKAIDVNISIMRAFVFIRQYALTHKDLTARLQELETKYDNHDKQFKDVYDAINFLLQKDKKKDKQESEQKNRI